MCSHMWIPFLAAGGRSTCKCFPYSRGQGAGKQSGHSLTVTTFSCMRRLSMQIKQVRKLQVSGMAKGGSLFQFTVQAAGETYELAATTQQERRRSAAGRE